MYFILYLSERQPLMKRKYICIIWYNKLRVAPGVRRCSGDENSITNLQACHSVSNLMHVSSSIFNVKVYSKLIDREDRTYSKRENYKSHPKTSLNCLLILKHTLPNFPTFLIILLIKDVQRDQDYISYAEELCVLSIIEKVPLNRVFRIIGHSFFELI